LCKNPILFVKIKVSLRHIQLAKKNGEVVGDVKIAIRTEKIEDVGQRGGT